MSLSPRLLSVLLFLLVMVFPESCRAADYVVNLGSAPRPATRRAIGFEWLYPYADAVINPYLVPLKPDVLKDPLGNCQKAKSTGAKRIQFLVGNGVVSQGYYPWQDYTSYLQYVDSRISSAVNECGGPLEWIIWQEPDSSDINVWSGSQAQFFETWRLTYQRIRQLRPNDPIIGPSTWYFNEPWLQAFLLYAKSNNVVPDTLSWHELFSIGENGFSPPDIYVHTNKIREFLQANGIYIGKINITEYQGVNDNYRPGVAVHFFANIERAWIEGTKGNWGINNDPAQLSGLVTDATAPNPRSIWWAYKAYADITGNIANAEVASAIDGVTGIDISKRESRTILGNVGPEGDKTITFNNIPPELIGKGLVSVEASKIINTELYQHTPPIPNIRYDATPVNGSLTISLPAFPMWGAYSVRLWNPNPPKPGDFNGDGFVNLADYEKLVTNFGNPYTIFDYNILVTNFER